MDPFEKSTKVPCCVSVSHAAHGSIRMEPVFMVLSQSAASAAGLAIDEGKCVQDVEYRSLTQRLVASRQIIVQLTGNAKPTNPRKITGIVVDDI